MSARRTRRAVLPTGVNAHDQWRYIGDLVLTWRVDDRLTSITEVNYVRDDGLKARAGGGGEYLTFALSPTMGAAIRAEVWRDAQGVFVAGYPGNLDYLNAEEGRPNGAYRGGPATYGEVTAGLNIKADPLLKLAHAPADSPLAGVTFRPEVRYDRILAGGAPFGGRLGGSKDDVTVGLDVVVPLSFQRGPGQRADGDRPARSAHLWPRSKRARPTLRHRTGRSPQPVRASRTRTSGRGPGPWSRRRPSRNRAP